MKSVELLAPAGSPEALDAAIGEGADAVYLGLKNFNARLRSANFAYSQFEGALKALRRMGRKLYVTVNTVFEQREADRVYQLLKYLAALGPDGLIVQDFGIITMVREHFPSLKLHASTQMNIASARGANALSKHGFSRVILARELDLDEIKAVRANTNMELEIFVHGALCISVSGLCLFSGYLGGKSANRGMCTQACRRFYRQGEEGGYYFSPGDLQLLEQIPDLVDAGVNSFKIEGRMKSAEYVGTVVSAYRRVIDGLGGGIEKNREAVQEGIAILRNDFARPKTAFYFDHEKIDWLNPAQNGGTGIPLGKLLRVKGAGDGRRGFIAPGPLTPETGDSIRLHRLDDSARESHKVIAVEREEGENPAGCWVSVPEGFESGDMVYLIQTRTMSKRYSPVIPRNLDVFKRMPGRDKAPPLDLPPLKREARRSLERGAGGVNGKKQGADFPEGLYEMVSRIDDLYIVQSVRPVKVFLAYNRKTAAYLLGNLKPLLPFSPDEIILVLDPFFPQAMDAVLAEEIPRLLNRGYRQFMVNNPGHFSYFKNLTPSASPEPSAGKTPSAVLIAGPGLYVFNRWANAFVLSLGTDFFTSPLENNRQNLEKTVSPGRRALTFITIFAYPPLFRIRADLGGLYQFGDFSDSRDEEFRLISGPDGSLVYPEKPFSIVDKVPFLQEAGFRRFILDLSGMALKKSQYKDLMTSVKNVLPVPNTSRFNWKDGFYRSPEPDSADTPAGAGAGRKPGRPAAG
jgi:putative protease